MASSEVDQKFLGAFAKNIGTDNPLLSSMLFKVLGLSVLLSKELVTARKMRTWDPASPAPNSELFLNIIWLSREGLRMIEQYVLPMVSTFSELKVLSYKIRASFYHVYALFHNQPSINSPKRPKTPPGLTSPHPPKLDKGKAPALGSPMSDSGRSPSQQPYNLEGGPVGGPQPPNNANFLVPAQDFIPVTLQCFQEASDLAQKHLWGSHPLRLSVKVEFAAFLYDCMHDHDESRSLAIRTITDVYNAQEGMDDEMFEDAAELVDVLTKMSKRGLGPNGAEGMEGGRGGLQVPGFGDPPKPTFPSPDMLNPI